MIPAPLMPLPAGLAAVDARLNRSRKRANGDFHYENEFK